jgi:hypothetical protein
MAHLCTQVLRIAAAISPQLGQRSVTARIGIFSEFDRGIQPPQRTQCLTKSEIHLLF